MSKVKNAAISTGNSKQSLGGNAIVKKYGSEYMSRLGKKGRRKQLKAAKSNPHKEG